MRDLTKSAQSLSNKASKIFISAIDKVEKANRLLQQAIEDTKQKNHKDSTKIDEIQQTIQTREEANTERLNMISSNESFIKNIKNIIE